MFSIMKASMNMCLPQSSATQDNYPHYEERDIEIKSDNGSSDTVKSLY